MIIELIILVISILILIFINGYSTLIALLICICLVFYFVRYCSRTLNQRIIAHRLAVVWLGISFCLKLCKQIFCFCKSLFSIQKYAVSTSQQHANSRSCGETLDLTNEIDTLVQNISRHYIRFWYNRISQNEDFLLHLNNAIKETLLGLCSGLTKLEKKKFSCIVIQIYLHFFSHYMDAKKASENQLTEHFQMKHWAIKDSSTEWCYLQSLVSALLDRFGPSDIENSFNSKYSSLLHTIIVEILTETLIRPLIRIICDPVRINLIILKILIIQLQNVHILDKSQPETKESIINSKDSKINCESQNNTVISKNTLSVPMCYTPVNDKILSNSIDLENPENVSMLRTSSIRSSSNSYLSNYSFNDANIKGEGSPISCDNSSIKRSKSADFIRHMPILKALNDKDYDIRLQKENNTILVALRCDSNLSCGVEQAEEAIAVEIPTLFTDVKITDTIQQNEDGLLPYTLYCIQYAGIFHDIGSTSDTPQFVTQLVSIKRRFSEFVTLHSRLEDNPDLKYYLKGIKGPSKWLTLPFSNLDKKYIAERKVFLEGYLKELCNSAPIAHSCELQEFLAYGGDARLSFVRRAGDIVVPRIDKIFVRGVKGAIDIFKTALPISSLEIEGMLPVRSPYEDGASFEPRFSEHLLDFSSREPEIKEHVNNYFHNSKENLSFNNVSRKFKSFDSKSKRSSLLRRLSNFKVEESCDCDGTHDDFTEEESPLGITIVELIDMAFNFNAMNLGDLRTKLILLLAPVLNKQIADQVDSLSEQHIASVLHSLHLYLWPNEPSVSKPNKSQENSSTLNEIIDSLEILFASNQFIHNEIFSIKSTVLERMKLFILSLQHEELNKCLLFHMFDVLIEFLCFKE